jgi:hypothetical protein
MMIPTYETYEPQIDWLTYKSYEYNRMNHPHIEADRWAKIFKNAEAYEEIYMRGRK